MVLCCAKFRFVTSKCDSILERPRYDGYPPLSIQAYTTVQPRSLQTYNIIIDHLAIQYQHLVMTSTNDREPILDLAERKLMDSVENVISSHNSEYPYRKYAATISATFILHRNMKRELCLGTCITSYCSLMSPSSP